MQSLTSPARAEDTGASTRVDAGGAGGRDSSRTAAIDRLTVVFAVLGLVLAALFTALLTIDAQTPVDGAPTSPRVEQLDCIANYESEHRAGSGGRADRPYNAEAHRRSPHYRTGYPTNTGNGYYNRYQFTRRTWDWVARTSIHRDWVGVRPDRAPADIQDSMAGELFRRDGYAHWPTPNRRCPR